ncbi:MAG: DNA-processing protein DprA [Pseudoruegeria sp.]
MTAVRFSSDSPVSIPSTEEEKVSWLRLIRSHRVGVVTFFRLIREHGTASAALEALPDVASKAGVQHYSAVSCQAAHQEMQAARSCGAQMICFGEPHYPSLLTKISDPPPVIWAIGNAALLNRPSAAIVGARNASSLGTRMAKKLAKDLGKAGYTIVSGLARGIDTAAHTAATDSGTVAVFGGGVDVVYPKENTALAHLIQKEGCIISEAAIGQYPQARHFPSRNRIVSGMTRATIVVEAAAKSGSLITAQTALDQSRDVLAVPGHPFDARASGCNFLLRDGATLVRSAEDVIEAIGPAQIAQPDHQSAPERALEAAPDMRQLHTDILARLGPSPIAEDQLIRDLSLPAPVIAPALVTLELDGYIARHPGGLLTLA